MNNKIKEYLDVLFSNIPYSPKANQLKEVLFSDMYKWFEDYIKSGKTEIQAYNLVIRKLGDIDEVLAEVMPSNEFIKQANYFRNRHAKNIAISVAMYIIGATFLIGLGGFGLFSDNLLTFGLTGLIVLLVISAIATGIIIYTNMSIPLEYKNYNKKTKSNVINKDVMDIQHSKLLNNILTIYWIIITVIYLVISFITGLWIFTWIIMLVASVFHFTIKMIFDRKYGVE